MHTIFKITNEYETHTHTHVRTRDGRDSEQGRLERRVGDELVLSVKRTTKAIL